MRARDSDNGRIRGAQRGGISKYNTKAINSTNAVEEIATVTINNTLLTYTQDNDPGAAAAEWDFHYPISTTGISRETNNSGRIATADIQVDTYDNVYHAVGIGAVTKFNSQGEQLAQFVVPIDASDAAGQHVFITSIAVDAYQNVYVGVGDEYNYLGSEYTRIFCYAYQDDGSYAQAWSFDTTDHHIVDLSIFNGDLITLEVEYGLLFTTGNESANKPNTKLRIYPSGANTVLPPSTPTVDIDLGLYTTDGDPIGRRIAVREDGVVYVVARSAHGSGMTNYPDTATKQSKGRIIKFNPYGDTPSTALWTLTAETYVMASESPNSGLGGVGTGIAVGKRNTSTGHYQIYSCGPRVDGSSGSGIDFDMIMIQDKGPSFDIDTPAGVGWGVTGASNGAKEDEGLGANLENLHRNHIRIAIDSDETTVAFPYGGYLDTAGFFTAYLLKAADGAAVETGASPNGNIEDSTYVFGLLGGTQAMVTAVAFPNTKPTYDDATVLTPERVYVGMTAKLDGSQLIGDHLHSRTLVTSTMAAPGTAPRTVKAYAVAAGNIGEFDNGSTVNTIGTASLQAAPTYVQAATLFEKAYFIDGLNYVEVDASDDSVTTWKSTTSGEIPPRCRLIEQWRGRMVLARDPEDPQNWHMSALGKPNDWQQFPPVITATQAISGNNSRSGLVPDIVNTMVPFTDDVLLFGGDKSIWRLTGDPMAGGQLDQVSGDTGMSFGRPWCLDPNGTLYFFGSKGGVFRMNVRGEIDRLSVNTIERRLQNVDLSTHFMRLVWGYREEGLYVYQVPYSTTGAIVSHWFWEASTDAWWEDKIGNLSKNPRSVHLIDGDAVGDRRVLLGGFDGIVRQVDLDANDDDGTGIDSYVTMGPIAPPDAHQQFLYTQPEIVLANDQGGARWELFADHEPDDLGVSKVSGGLVSGRNPAKPARVRGDVVYLRLRNATADERWAYEKGVIRASRGGRARVR